MPSLNRVRLVERKMTEALPEEHYLKLARPKETLRSSEIRYRRLFESARDGILILNADTLRITDVNPFMSELLNYSYDEFLQKELRKSVCSKISTRANRRFESCS